MTIFIVIKLHGIKAFLLNFLVRWVSVGWEFLQISWWKTGGGCTKSRFAEDLHTRKLDGEACVFHLCFACLFIFLLFVFFIVCLCVYFLFIFYGAVCWVMYQLCDLALLEGVWGCCFCGAVCRFCWVSSGLFYSPVGLMQNVMESLHSFLT